jgi:hypothetical protein
MKMYYLRQLLLVAALLIAVISFVYAVPTVPTAPQRVTRLEDERFDPSNFNVPSLEAEAGNVTRIDMYALTQTQTWQGFYGEIRGTITLDDAQNWTFYDWDMAEPQGEIYATPALISNWQTVHCLNYSAKPNYCFNRSVNTTLTNYGQGSFFSYNVTVCNEILNASGDQNWTHEYLYWYDFDHENMSNTKNTTTISYLNRSILEEGNLEWSLGLLPGDYDGVDETFNESGQVTWNYSSGSNRWVNHSTFWVGTVEIRQGTCPAADMYQTVCMNITNPDRDQQFPVFYQMNDTQTPDMIITANYTLCDTFLVKESAFNNTYLFNISLGNSSHGNIPSYNLNLSGQVFKYMASDYGADFQEVLLTVNDSQTIIYATIIENDNGDDNNDPRGFDNATHDFQLIVGDDGHAGPKQDTTTTYYFYVEIE